MSRESNGPSGRHRRGKQGVGTVLLWCGLPALASCLEFRDPAAVPPFLSFAAASSVQEGEVTVADGGQAKVRYPHPFQAPPRLVIVEIRQAQFEEHPYAKSDFQFVTEEASFFTIRNNHPEQGRGSCATVKWRAEGSLAREQPGEAGVPQTDKTAQELLIERVKKVGGSVSFDPAQPRGPVVGIDLHRTRVTDADLGQLFPPRPPATDEVDGIQSPTPARDVESPTRPARPEPPPGLGGLRSLTLYGTQVSDAGLEPVGRLTHLQSLHLSDTPVTDAGLQHLRELTELRELGLNRTRVTDAGLSQLRGLPNLSSLALDGTRITDAGLVQLKGFPRLKRLFLNRTGVTPAGVQELKRTMPNLQILQ
jgi:hypothetical protein